MKTRLQGRGGLAALGGYTGLYRGLAPVLAGSVPTAAVFFWVYDGSKRLGGAEGRVRVQTGQTG